MVSIDRLSPNLQWFLYEATRLSIKEGALCTRTDQFMQALLRNKTSTTVQALESLGVTEEIFLKALKKVQKAEKRAR